MLDMLRICPNLPSFFYRYIYCRFNRDHIAGSISKNHHLRDGSFGSGAGIRTQDQWINSPLLYR